MTTLNCIDVCAFTVFERVFKELGLPKAIRTGGTYRAVYTIKFKEAVFVMHCIQTKSRRGIVTPTGDLGIVRARLKGAQTLAKKLRHEGG